MTGLFDHCVDQLEVSRFLAAIAEVDFSCIRALKKKTNKQTREMDTTLSKRDRS